MTRTLAAGVAILAGAVEASAQTWTTTAGSWSTPTNWTPASVPNAVDATAGFNAAANNSSAVDLGGGAFTVGTLNLDAASANSGFQFLNGTLIMQSSGTAAINVQSSNPVADFIATLQLNSNTEITTGSSAASFVAGGTVSGGGGLTIAGPGNVTLAGANSYSGGTTVNAGTLTGSHATAGVIDAFGSGTITMAGGTLRTTVSGSLANTLDFVGGSPSTVSAATGTNLSLDGQIQLVNSGMIFGSATDSGTIQLNLAGGSSVTYSSTVAVNGGTLLVDDNSFFTANAASTSVNGNATLDFSLSPFGQIRNLQGSDSTAKVVVAHDNTFISSGNFAGSIVGTGMLNLSNIGFGAGTLVLSGTNSYSGGTTIDSGFTLQLGTGGTTGSIVGNVGDYGTLAFNRSDTTTFAGQIFGDGQVQHNGTGTTILTAANTYSGGTTVNAGTLLVNGSITSDVIVNSGGTLGGIGSVGNVTVNGGGTLAPNSSGSFAINGSLAFQSGAIYQVQFGASSASAASVTGTAALTGGIVRASLGAGGITKTTNLLHAAGGFGGTTFSSATFSGVEMANLNAALSYTPTDVYLNLTATLGVGANLNANQGNVATALNNAFNNGATLPAGVSSFYGLTGNALAGALSQATGETATGTLQTTFNAMGQFAGLLTDPALPRSGVPNPTVDASAYAGEAPGFAGDNRRRDAYAMFAKAAPHAGDQPRWSAWATAFGGSQATDGNAAVGSTRTTSSVFGTAVGADYLLSPNTVVGFALAGGGTSFGLNALGTGRSDLFQAGAFVRHWNGPAYVSAALAYGWQSITTDRSVTIAGADRLHAAFKANAYSGRVEGGYRLAMPWSGSLGMTPYAAAQFTTLDLPAYAEQATSGSTAFALAYGGKSVTDTRSELGLRTDKSFAMPDGIVTLRGRLAWAHDFNPDRSVAAAFQSLPAASFVVHGAAQARDSTLTSASAEMRWLNGWSAAGTFEGEYSNVTKSYAGKASVRYAW